MPGSRALIGAGIFLLALALRVIYLLQVRSSPLFDMPVMDALYHHQWALRLAAGDWIGNEAFFRAPLYPYFLGIIYKVFGQNFLIPRLIQLIIGSLSCVLIWLIARNLFDRRVGLISGIIAALYGPFMFFEAELLITPFIVFLGLYSIYLLIRNKFFWAGLVLGMAAITRPNILIFILFVPLLGYFFLKRGNHAGRNRSMLSIFVPWIGVLLFVAPVTLRNWAVSKDFVVIASQGGVNFYIGNNPHSNGITAIVPGTRGTWWGGYHDAVRMAETASEKKLKPSEVSDFWFKQSFDFIRGQPFAWTKLMLRKTCIFWFGWEPPNNKDIGFFSRYSRLLSMLVWRCGIFIPFGLLAPLALCGIFASLRKWRKHMFTFGFIFFYMISVIAFFVCSRFRIPVAAGLIPYASFFLVYMWRKIRERDKTWIPYASAFVALAVLLNLDFLQIHETDRVESNFMIGTTCSKKGMYSEALDYLSRVVKEQPERADVHNNIGNVYARQDRDKEALHAYFKAINADPSYEKTYFNLGTFCMKHKKYEQAVGYYRKAIELDPDYELALYYAGIAYSKTEEPDSALSMWNKVVEINPRNSKAIKKIQEMQDQR
jgi:Flp pilus assembly protein TadD/4-amino-4-deoxy-L-arabinose transferase-like glycosyltransferase